jgi:hypothetical protein
MEIVSWAKEEQMYKILSISVMVLSLSACGKSSEEKKADWITFCTANDFSAKQCAVLYTLKSSSDDAAELSGINLGLTATKH